MKEIEVKVLDINVDKTKDLLYKVNAKPVKKELQINYMYDYPDGRFFKKSGYVRVRKAINLLDNNKENIIITFKELISKDQFKVAKEVEFNADSFEKASEFLISIGLIQIRVDEKYRESFELESSLVEIDQWAGGVPTYFEVEASSEEKIISTLNILGYKLSDSTSMTLKEIMVHYNLDNSNRIFTELEKQTILGKF